VRALIHLALQPAGRRLSQVDLASAIEAPAPFVGKVMQQLASAGLVTSHRGIGGGFALSAAAAGATMLDAVTAVDGPIALNSCLSPDEPCGRASFCPAHLVWHDAQLRVTEVLRSATIRGLAEQAGRPGAGASPAASVEVVQDSFGDAAEAHGVTANGAMVDRQPTRRQHPPRLATTRPARALQVHRMGDR
jgi:Rrf2 family protein